MLPVFATAFGYAVLGSAAQYALGRPWLPALIDPAFLVLWTAGSILWLARPGRLPIRRDQIVTALLLVAIVAPFQSTFQGLKQSIGQVAGFPLDPLFAQIDATLHGGPAWHWLAWMFAVPGLVPLMDLFYAVGWFVGVLAFQVWVCWTDSPLRTRAVLTCLWTWILGGTVGAWLLASAGPCYAGDPAFAPLLAQLQALELTAVRVQAALWGAHLSDGSFPFAGVSAMPSMHVAMATVIAMTGSAQQPRYRWAFWTFAGLVQIGSVLTGWHYAIDGYAGALIAWGCWAVAGLKMPAFALSSFVLRPRLFPVDRT